MWREIAPQIASQTPGYLALTVTLAGEVEARDAAPMIEALLNERAAMLDTARESAAAQGRWEALARSGATSSYL
jgi:hypothetical protein